MAYCIFLKSLRILEEFRKYPRIKIPHKSPCANSQSPTKFQNPLGNWKSLLLEILSWNLARPTQAPWRRPILHRRPPPPQPAHSACEPVGGHKMHIFTANIHTFHSRYRRYVLITNEFYEFCWYTILGTSDDGKAPYVPKSIHIFIISKIRHSHK
jgi:hypothetical protein